MSGVISESYQSRPFTVGLGSSGRELVFDILDTDDEAEVQTLLLGAAPAVYQGLILDSVEGEPIGSGVWKGHARYVRPEVEYTFDTTGGTQKVTQSYETINSYAPSGMVAPDFGGAIGVSEDKVEGVDVPAPKLDFTETHVLSGSIVTDAYKVSLSGLTGRMNGATWRTYAAGEVVFMGASGSSKGNGQWAVTFKFSTSPNVSGLTIADMTIDKLGWDYLWFRYADFDHLASYSLVKRPVAAYVERVLRVGDFSVLGI